MGTSQVSGAITSSTITTVIVFLPIVYLHGASGALFRDQAWTITFSLVSSLVAAILLIPMLYNIFFQKQQKKQAASKSVQVKGYGRFLGRVLQYKWAVIIIAICLTWLISPSGSIYRYRVYAKIRNKAIHS